MQATVTWSSVPLVGFAFLEALLVRWSPEPTLAAAGQATKFVTLWDAGLRTTQILPQPSAFLTKKLCRKLQDGY